MINGYDVPRVACDPCALNLAAKQPDESVQSWLEKAQNTLSECELHLAQLNTFLNARYEPENAQDPTDCLLAQARNLSYQSNRIYSSLMSALRELGVNR